MVGHYYVFTQNNIWIMARNFHTIWPFVGVIVVRNRWNACRGEIFFTPTNTTIHNTHNLRNAMYMVGHYYVFAQNNVGIMAWNFHTIWPFVGGIVVRNRWNARRGEIFFTPTNTTIHNTHNLHNAMYRVGHYYIFTQNNIGIMARNFHTIWPIVGGIVVRNRWNACRGKIFFAPTNTTIHNTHNLHNAMHMVGHYYVFAYNNIGIMARNFHMIWPFVGGIVVRNRWNVRRGEIFFAPTNTIIHDIHNLRNAMYMVGHYYVFAQNNIGIMVGNFHMIWPFVGGIVVRNRWNARRGEIFFAPTNTTIHNTHNLHNAMNVVGHYYVFAQNNVGAMAWNFHMIWPFVGEIVVRNRWNTCRGEIFFAHTNTIIHNLRNAMHTVGHYYVFV
jgi:hypothetical protein